MPSPDLSPIEHEWDEISGMRLGTPKLMAEVTSKSDPVMGGGGGGEEGRSSVIECPLMMRWVIGSIPPGGPIEQFLVPASIPQLVYAFLSVERCILKNPFD